MLAPSMVFIKFFSFLSLRTLVIVGFALTVLPCVLAVAFSVLAIEELAGLSKATVYQVAQISEKTQMLRERLMAMERKGKQYLVLREGTLRDSYVQTHRQTQLILSQLEQYSKEPGLRSQLSAMKDLNVRLVRVVTGISAPAVAGERAPPPVNPNHDKDSRQSSDQQPGDLFTQMNQLGEEMGRLSTQAIDRLVQDLERETNSVQKRILFRTTTLIPASLILISAFIYLITRPIRQLERAIRQLGTGNLQDAIDVSGPKDLRYLGQRLEWLRDQLTRLERAKQRFVGNVSHELKTPLANIHEGATLLADQIVGEMNSEQQGIVEIMLSNSQKLEHLISKLIHYGSASGTYNKARRERVDVRELVQAVVEDYQLRLRAKSISLIQRLSPAVMSGNREQLRLIVDNLLSNAVKYSPDEGSIALLLAEKEGDILLEVQDDGPGISGEDRAMVFDPFYRANPGRDLTVKGSGLGLAIVRECVASHQGRIDVVNPHSGRSGACFRVRMPVDPYV